MHTHFPLPMPGKHPNGVQLGGLGTGRVELGCNGRITLAQVCHSPQRILSGLEGTFFSLRADQHFCLLQGEPLDDIPGCDVAYRGKHPVAEVGYKVPHPHLRVSLTAFSPLVPHELARSTLPGALFTFHLQNPGPAPVAIQLGFSWEHLLGCGGWGVRGLSLSSNRTGNRIEPATSGEAAGLHFTGGHAHQLPDTRGEMALMLPKSKDWEIHLLQHWNVLLDRGQVLEALCSGLTPERFDGGSLAERLQSAAARSASPPSWDDPDPRFGGGREGLEGAIHPAGTLLARLVLAPGTEIDVPFALSWLTRTHHTADGREHGRFCARHEATAPGIAARLLRERQTLLTDTTALHRLLAASSLPVWWQDKLLNDLTPLTTNTLIDRQGTLHTLEASPMMFGALGTLDQRLVSHPGTSLFFPDLNRSELDLFGRLQAADGSLPHFTGNAHTALGSDEVEYGRTGWPDLCCSYILQLYRDWRDTGEDRFVRTQLPRVWKAADYLFACDQDGDGIPEGGSSWDIEHYEGAFIATATLWLATLKVLIRMAEQFDPNAAPRFHKAVPQAEATLQTLWLGSHYAKFRNPRTGEFSEDIFVGQLAGEWVSRQLGLGPLLPPQQVQQSLRTLYAANGNPERYALMPIQVRRDGSLSGRKYCWHAWPQYTLTFVDCTAFHLGMQAEAMENLQRFDTVMREINRSPWATTLWHDARDGQPDFGSFMGLDWYMNAPAVWWTLPAVSGASFDAVSGELLLQHAAPLSAFPLVTPRLWALLSLSGPPEAMQLSLEIHRTFRGPPPEMQQVRHPQGILTFTHPIPLEAGRTLTFLLSPTEPAA